MAGEIPSDPILKESLGAPVFPARLDWPSTIGSFLLNFGTIHMYVVSFLRDQLENNEFEAIRNQPFKNQLTRIAQHVQTTGRYSSADKVEFAQLLERVEPLRVFRNHIAHGYFLVRFDPEIGTPILSLGLPKDVGNEYADETRYMTFAELRAGVVELNVFDDAIKRLLGWKPGWGAAETDR